MGFEQANAQIIKDMRAKALRSKPKMKAAKKKAKKRGKKGC